MSLIDTTYFSEQPVMIPNVTTTSNGVPTDVSDSLTARLTHIISVYEPKYLKLMLGDDIYADFIAGLATVPIPAKWTALKAKFIDSTNKISPIANYVYVQYLNLSTPVYSGVGAVNQKSDNAVNVDLVSLGVIAWNDMYIRNIEIADWLILNADTYETTTHLLPEEDVWYATGLFAPKNRVL